MAISLLHILLFSAVNCLAFYVQQGPKLVGSAYTTNPTQGSGVAITDDGNTVLIGAPQDTVGDLMIGGAYIFTRSPSGVWLQEGSKIVGTYTPPFDPAMGDSVALSGAGDKMLLGGLGKASPVTLESWVFGRMMDGEWIQQERFIVSGETSRSVSSVALSKDGDTAIIGAHLYNNTGAAWIFYRENTTWIQQGGELIGAGGVIGEDIGLGLEQGRSVGLSGDGNTAIVGGIGDNYTVSPKSIGAAWIFVRSNGSWIQEEKLVGTGVIKENAKQGTSVALSYDGNTALVGGPYDDRQIGAAWVFVRSSGTWTQQAKLVGTGVGLLVSEGGWGACQGSGVALSKDGNVAAIGGFCDNLGVGATWIFTRTNGVWTQFGSKLVGSGSIGESNQGKAIALSSDGTTVVVGGALDANLVGAAWVFTLPTSSPTTATPTTNLPTTSPLITKDDPTSSGLDVSAGIAGAVMGTLFGLLFFLFAACKLRKHKPTITFASRVKFLGSKQIENTITVDKEVQEEARKAETAKKTPEKSARVAEVAAKRKEQKDAMKLAAAQRKKEQQIKDEAQQKEKQMAAEIRRKAQEDVRLSEIKWQEEAKLKLQKTILEIKNLLTDAGIPEDLATSYTDQLIEQRFDTAAKLKVADVGDLVACGFTRGDAKLLYTRIAAGERPDMFKYPVRPPQSFTTLRHSVLPETNQMLDMDKPTVMISYQWESQEIAIRIRDHLNALGKFNVIIDIKGIKGNFLEWMEKSVNESMAVIILVNRDYEKSSNCKQEASRAHELKKKIIPIYLDPLYTPGGWLGMVRAGLIHYDGSTPEALEKSLNNIVSRELVVE